MLTNNRQSCYKVRYLELQSICEANFTKPSTIYIMHFLQNISGPSGSLFDISPDLDADKSVIYGPSCQNCVLYLKIAFDRIYRDIQNTTTPTAWSLLQH